jgi:hypothetical protein
MIFHDLKLIFLHPPRTGGSIITHSLAGSTKKHIKHLVKTKERYPQYPIASEETHRHHSFSFWKKNFSEESKSYIKIGTVRNPFDWLVSLYYYFPPKNKQNTINCSFKEFIEKMVEKKSLTVVHSDYVNTSCFFHEFLKEADYIIYFENLKDDLRNFFVNMNFDKEEIKKRLSILDIQLPSWKTNNRKKDYRIYYTPKLRSFVEKHWEKDLIKFDYFFNNSNEENEKLKKKIIEAKEETKKKISNKIVSASQKISNEIVNAPQKLDYYTINKRRGRTAVNILTENKIITLQELTLFIESLKKEFLISEEFIKDIREILQKK